MKAVKLAGIRLINYINKGINWKDHKDVIMDYWLQFHCHEYGYNMQDFKGLLMVKDLPVKARDDYEKWFNKIDFPTFKDENWVKFIDGKLNLFYDTKRPEIMPDDTWYVELMKSEEKANLICDEQLYHGQPNLNALWKVETISKPEEVGGRRNGYMFTTELKRVSPEDTKGYYYAVAFQCPETVKLRYSTEEGLQSKCINWAANAKNMTKLKIIGGRFLVERVFVKGKAWKPDKHVPEANTPIRPLTGSALLKYITKNFQAMYGYWEDIEADIKQTKEATNMRKQAINTFNDEEVRVSTILYDGVKEFINNGNVSDNRRERNKKIRTLIRDKNKLREREIKKKIRELEKTERRTISRRRQQLRIY